MIVVDTNIVAYLPLNGDRTRVARELLNHDAEWCSDSFLLHEFANVLATAIRVRGLDAVAAQGALRHAERILRHRLTQTPHEDALTIACRFGISAYDARFIGAAIRFGKPLVTEDARLRRAVPELTQSMDQALAAL